MKNEKIEAWKRQKINKIVYAHNFNVAVKLLVEDGLCVSKAEAKRVWIQKRGKE